MALVCDLPAVIKEFKSKTETVPVAFGELWKRTHAVDLSPLPGLGKSLDPNEQNRRTSQRKSDVSQASKQAEAAKASNKTKIIVFEPPKQSPQKLFSYEPVTNVVVQHSALSSIVGHVSKIDVIVFIPQHRRPVRLKVAQTATFQQLIVATIKNHNDTHPKIPLFDESEAYLVRIATEDGQIDDMFPGTLPFLSCKSILFQFNYYTMYSFAVCSPDGLERPFRTRLGLPSGSVIVFPSPERLNRCIMI
jgi:hypothetical protein